jgi:hypothetical protein
MTKTATAHIAPAQDHPAGARLRVHLRGVFGTPSKDNPDPPNGLAGLRTNLALMRARADSFVVISALMGAPDPSAAGASCTPSSIRQ